MLQHCGGGNVAEGSTDKRHPQTCQCRRHNPEVAGVFEKVGVHLELVTPQGCLSLPQDTLIIIWQCSKEGTVPLASSLAQWGPAAAQVHKPVNRLTCHLWELAV